MKLMPEVLLAVFHVLLILDLDFGRVDGSMGSLYSWNSRRRSMESDTITVRAGVIRCLHSSP